MHVNFPLDKGKLHVPSCREHYQRDQIITKISKQKEFEIINNLAIMTNTLHFARTDHKRTKISVSGTSFVITSARMVRYKTKRSRINLFC